MLVIVAWLASLRVRNYERGAPRQPPHHQEERQARFDDFRSGVWMQTLLRDPAAGRHALAASTSGSSACSWPPCVLEIDHQLPGVAEVPARHASTRRYTFGADIAGRPVPRSASAGRSCAATSSALPHPHQDQARRRGDPRHVPRSSASPASSPRRCRIALVGRPGFEKWSFIGYPLSRLFDDAGRRRTCATRTGGSWAHPRRRLLRVPRDPARPPSCATCSRRR